MKQTLFMVAVTSFGVVAPFLLEPYFGVAVYYLFAVLRPQSIWEWALPAVGWSGFVAWATLLSALWIGVSSSDPRPQVFTAAHKAFFCFGAWICITYLTALDQTVAWIWLQEYLKLFIMFGVAAYILREVKHVWLVYRLAAIALIYIAYEMNYLYFVNGRLDIYHNGYGGLDNNGAGLMLAMGVPLAINAWESTKGWNRWAYLAGVPLLMHAILMSYSRGAMVSLLVAVPQMVFRSQKKAQFSLALVGLLSLVPYLAGQEIRDRFFSVQEYDTDASANARFDSWTAAIRIANRYPIFGVGIRNSNLVSNDFGADMVGRTIHSQYLQTLADAGYPGLSFYLVALGLTWWSMARARSQLRRSDSGDEGRLGIGMLNGVEGSLLVFCIGGAFLSLEVFELPYLVALIGAQVSMIAHVRRSDRSSQHRDRDVSPVRRINVGAALVNTGPAPRKA